MAISIYPVVCVHPCRLLRTQQHFLWPNGKEHYEGFAAVFIKDGSFDHGIYFITAIEWINI